MPPRPTLSAGATPASTAASTPPEDARQRLLHAAVRLFASKGFGATSTRELAEAASVNVAAISYYFGDKAGLYRATFIETQAPVAEHIALYDDPGYTLRQALQGLYAGFIEPLKQGELVQQCMKLFFREVVEPTGLLAEIIASEVQPNHDALVQVLCRHLGLAEADADLHRLALCLGWAAVQLHIGPEVNLRIAPQAFSAPEALAQWQDRLVAYGLAMVQAEAERRGVALNVDQPCPPARAGTRTDTP